MRSIVVPVVNVDGFAYTKTIPVEKGNLGPSKPILGGDGVEGIVLGGQGQYVRKNRRPILGSNVGEGLFVEREKPTNLDALLTGVDPNRNYAYSWGDDQGGSSASTFDQTYRGTDPLSEQESKNVADLLKSRHVTAMITHHTSGDMLLWAWGDTNDDAPDNDFLEGLGRAMAVYNGYEAQEFHRPVRHDRDHVGLRLWRHGRDRLHVRACR